MWALHIIAFNMIALICAEIATVLLSLLRFPQITPSSEIYCCEEEPPRLSSVSSNVGGRPYENSFSSTTLGVRPAKLPS